MSRISFLLSLILLLNSCSPSYQQRHYKAPQVDFSNLDDLEQLHQIKHGALKSDTSGIRADILRDTALSLGAQSGLYTRSIEINESTGKHAEQYDKIFDFRRLVMDQNVLPPVLIESRNNLAQTSDNTLRLSDQTYKIISQAKFVTNPPNWRDYLYLNYSTPEAPANGLLPKNSEEERIWQQSVKSGWKQGYEQADSIFAENMGRLKRDYQGMVLYKTLLAKNMVSEPVVAKRDLGITGNGENLAVNDRMLTITALPSLDPKGEDWKSGISG